MLLDELTFFTDPRDRPFGGAQQQDIESLRTESIANRIGIGSQIVSPRISNLETGYGFRTTEYREDDLNDTVEHQFALAWNRQLSPAYRSCCFTITIAHFFRRTSISCAACGTMNMRWIPPSP
jgi:hypothetical protein